MDNKFDDKYMNVILLGIPNSGKKTLLMGIRSKLQEWLPSDENNSYYIVWMKFNFNGTNFNNSSTVRFVVTTSITSLPDKYKENIHGIIHLIDLTQCIRDQEDSLEKERSNKRIVVARIGNKLDRIKMTKELINNRKIKYISLKEDKADPLMNNIIYKFRKRIDLEDLLSR